MILIIVIGLILFKEMRPYIGGFMGASTLYVLLRGQMKTLTEKKKMSRGVAATIILLEALFIFLIPLTGIGFMVADTISGIKIDPEAVKVSVYTFLIILKTVLILSCLHLKICLSFPSWEVIWFKLWQPILILS